MVKARKEIDYVCCRMILLYPGSLGLLVLSGVWIVTVIYLVDDTLLFMYNSTSTTVQLYNYKLQKAHYYSTVVFIIIVVYT